MAASIFISGWGWLWPSITLFAFGIVILFWSYRTTKGLGTLRLVCFLLKTAALAALAFCLLEPFWSGQRAKPGANLMLLAADNSQSLQIRDRDSKRTRGEQLRGLMDPMNNDWQGALDRFFENPPF